MKKGPAFLLIGMAFVAGIVVGVVMTVLYEEKTLDLVSPPAATLSLEIQQRIQSLQAAIKNDPRNLKALIELGNAYFDTEQFDPAIEMYSRALEIEPMNSDVRTDRGIMYRRKGETDRALADFKKAAADDPKHLNSRYNLGVVLLHDKNDIKGAIRAWEDYLALDPRNPRAENIRIQIAKMKAMVK